MTAAEPSNWEPPAEHGDTTRAPTLPALCDAGQPRHTLTNRTAALRRDVTRCVEEMAVEEAG
jgi:hypothetical protein